MNTIDLNNKIKKIRMNQALRDIILESSEQELRDALGDTGNDFDSLATQGRAIAQCALANFEKTFDIPDLHRGLGALIQLLRRRDRLSADQLAYKANIDLDELHRIEIDPTFEPNPRTIFQLENYFRLPSRTLVLLSGAVHVRSEVREEAMRFAASAQSISELTRDELKLLNRFVKFLQEYTDK